MVTKNTVVDAVVETMTLHELTDGDLARMADSDLARMADGDLARMTDGDLANMADGDLAHMTDGDLANMADVELARMAQETGSEAAQCELCNRYTPLLYGTVASLKKTWTLTVDEEWQDLEGYLWIVLLEAIQEYNVDGSVPFAGFLNSKIKCGGPNYLRKASRHNGREFIALPDSDDSDDGTTLLDGVYEYTPECCALDHEVSECLHKGLMKLDPPYRKVLMDLVLNGRKGSELAAELGISRQAINRRKKAALAALEAQLLADGTLSKDDLQVADVRKIDSTLFN